MTGDGHLDLVVSGSDDGASRGYVSILAGDGLGGVTDASSFAAGSGPTSLVVLDVNHDGLLDVAASDPPQSQVIILVGDGEVVVESDFIAVGSGPAQLASGDLDGDGFRRPRR
jgi:hypothetical protein